MPEPSTSFRSVFLGTPEFAVPSLNALCEAGLAPSLVVTQPTKRRSRRGEPEPSPVAVAAAKMGIEVIETENTSKGIAFEKMKLLEPDLGIVVAFGQILRKSVLNLPKHGCINLHPSLLPKYRGAAPINGAILDGVEESGITVMRLVRKLDAGPILFQQSFHIPKSETSEIALERAGLEGARALVHVVKAFSLGTPPQDIPQNDADATYAGMLDRASGLVNWDKPASAVWNQIRGVQPWPKAESHVLRKDGVKERVVVWRAEEAQNPRPDAQPGEIVAVKANGVVVACGQGTALLLTELQTDGRKRMDAGSLLRGWRIEVGDRMVAV